ncbi:TetR family transcriptional regulator [Kitasatospora sp. CM 4170]|uniref:TetR/AcrR family transcriptional regulator n=1 Tax=Kitasatospora aburaviensis TaxID=67265 RepID=A0ABW1EUC8_9ACTN|nr:TetR family transcriptional regulator [Kitasatospora sp. CM 4170]WNM43677.1 TetR family transcriptional regulator [Kitasatospora sp. CM 4170]
MSDAEEEAGLRERKKQRTRRLITDTARRLFAERGFEQVSVTEVAKAADVSAGTVFNYFPTKEDLVYSGLERFETELLQAVHDRGPGESVLAAFGRFVLTPRGLLAARDQGSAKQLLAVSHMIGSSPALLAREQQILARYTESLARLLVAETRASADDPRPAVTAAALIGVHRTLIDYVRRRILAGDHDIARLAEDTHRYGETALTHLQEGFGDYGRR